MWMEIAIRLLKHSQREMVGYDRKNALLFFSEESLGTLG
jgi:hypothetical protein